MLELEELIRIVLAENDQDDVLLFKLAVGQLPFDVQINHAEDGEKLFILLRQFIPDIIFLDINLPYKDGISCLAEIRRNHIYDNVPVIMYTGYKSEKYIADSFAKGANFYVLKIAAVSELAERLSLVFSVDWKKMLYYPSKSNFVVGGDTA